MTTNTVFLNVDYEGWFAEIAQRRGGLGVSRPAKRVLLTDSNRKVIEYWHNKVIPRHFETSARYRYHYQKRKPPYVAIKKALARGERVIAKGRQLPAEKVVKGGQVDVVRAGSTERKAEAPAPIRSTENKAVVRLKVPRYAGDRRNRTGRPNMGREIKTITNREKQTMVRVWKMAFMRGVRTHGKAIFKVRRKLSRST